MIDSSKTSEQLAEEFNQQNNTPKKPTLKERIKKYSNLKLVHNKGQVTQIIGYPQPKAKNQNTNQ